MIPSFAYYIMALRREFIEFCNIKLQEIGLTQGQLFFLIYIGKHEHCSPKEMSKSLHMDNAHVTRSITKLVEDNFISQIVNPMDKRAHILTLTDKGKHAFQVSHEIFTEWDEKIMQDVPDEQRKEIVAFLERLVHRKNENTLHCNNEIPLS